jgi:putative transposase
LEQCIPALQPVEHKGRLVSDVRAMSDDPDFEYLIIDSTIVRAHQHAAGAKKVV